MWIEVSKVAVYFFFCTNVAYAYSSKQIGKYSDSYYNKYSSSVSVSSLNNDKSHQSRYPKLDKVKSRIENMNTQSYPLKIRHNGRIHRPFTTTTTTTTTTTDDGLFENYGGLEDDDDFEDYSSELEDEDDELEYDDDDNAADTFSDDVDVQAEEPTERPVTYRRPSSSLTDYKWEHYGTISRVAESRDRLVNSAVSKRHKEIKAVIEHITFINQRGRCRNPSPKLIPVQKIHPDPTKVYTPHCTVLHRCAEDTGCCKDDNKCQWKSRETVYLYFYVKTLGSPQTSVEKLAFFNDTECECKEISNSGESPSISSSELGYKSAEVLYKAPPVIRCKQCPKHFSEFINNNKCSCDCEKGNIDCTQLKEGKEHLSMIERICISNNKCNLPVCEFGTYVEKEGKCPSKKDKMDYYRQMINY